MSIVEGLSRRILFIAAFIFAAQGESFSANVPYFTDFESGIGTEWSSTNRSTAYPQYFTTFSGRFGNESQSLTIGGLTVGQSYTVGCDLYVIDSWDGSPGPDTFAIEVDGNQSFRETFSNYNGNPPSNPQSFPYSPDLGRFDMGFNSSFVDAIYRNIEVTFTASNATSVITFRGISLQDINDESWGIDNVYVKTAAQAAQSQINVTSLPDNNSTVSRIVESFSVTANHPLDPTSASAASNYNLVEAGANGTFGNSDDVIISLSPQFTSGKSVALTIATAQAPLQPGKYRFVISNLKDTNNAALLGYTNTFTIANPVLGQIESLSNDTIPTAISLSLTESPVGSRLFTAFALGRFTTTSDVDYWRFNAEAGDLVTVRLEADDLGVYPRAFLQDSSGTGLNNSYGNYEGVVGFQNYRISTPGTFYVRTYTDNKASGYRMRVDVARGLQYESEDNDSFNQANALNLTIISGAYSATVAGALETYDGAGDYFRLGILNPGNALALNLAYPQGGTLSASNSTIEIYKEGSSAAVATNNGTSLNFTILEDGNYFARLVNNAPDIRAQYLLNLNIVDGVAPVVTATTLPTEGSSLNTIVDRFTVSFSEELQAASAMLASNYELRSAGADNTFGNGDDVLYTLAPQSYTSGLTVSFLITDGPLQSGKYRFTAKTTLKDRADNALGAAYTRSFTVDTLPGYARESRDNDTGATATDLVLAGNSGENFKVASGQGNLSSSSDKDYWSFQASQGDLVIITTESTSHASGTGLLWYILKEDGNQLTYFYSDSNGTGQSPPITIPADGKYLLLPQRWYDYFDEYRFRVSISHPQTPGALVGETEGNNNVNQANVPALQLNAGVQSVQILGVGTYGDPGDVFRLGNLAFGAEIQANIYTPSNSAFQGKLDILRQDGTSVASSAEGATNVSFTIPADGANIYYLKITDTTAGALDHHYFATLKVNDSTAPIITSISLPDEGSTNTYVGADFSIGFSEDMLASTVNTNVNYELKNTTTGDLYAISNGNYSSGLSVGLSIIDGPLQPGNYQFTIKTALKDKNGNSLAAAVVRKFNVQGVSGYVYENRGNDSISTATSLSLAPQNSADGSFDVTANKGGLNGNGWGIASGKLDADNKVDFVVASYGGGAVGVYLTTSSNTFADCVIYPTGSGTISVALADFNGDSKLDVVAANYSDNNYSILFGNGDGSFTSATNAPTGGNRPRSVAVADVNGDSKQDLIFANETSHNVAVLLGNGNGTFQSPVTYPVSGNNPYKVLLVDVNGDQILDVITANASSANISILQGNGNGTFGTATVLAASSTPRGVASGDFNHDGRTDLAVINAGNNTVGVFLRKADGTFTDQVTYGAASSDPYDIIAADITGNGATDLIVASYGNSYITVLNGNADGTFTDAVRTYVSGNPISVIAGDYNADGRLDLATGNHIGQSISILSGRASQLLTEDPVGSGIRTGSGRGFLANSSDVDYWSFSAKAGDRLVVASETPGSPNNTGLFWDILGSQGDRVTYFYADQAGWGQNSPYIIPADGTYFIKVSQWQSYYGEYRFRVTLAPASIQLESENNNSFAQANSLDLKLQGGHQKATVLGYFSAGDRSGDYYNLGNLSAGTAIRLNVARPGSSKAYPRINIYDGQNAVVYQGSGLGTNEFIIPPGGDGAYKVWMESLAPARTTDAGPFLVLNGANQYVNTGTWTPGAVYTVEAWVRPSAYYSSRRAIAGAWSSCQDWGLTIVDGRFGVSIRPPSGCSDTVLSDERYELDRWYHVAATCDGTTAKIYVNGALKKSAPVASDYSPAGNGLWIGNNTCCGEAFAGVIDEVSVWNRALSDSEISTGINQALAGTEPGLLGYWQFDEGSGTTIADRSSSAHNGTVINGAAWSGAGAADTIPYSLFAQYILDIDLGDTAPPTITSVNLPVEGSSTTFVNPAFTIGFSEDMSMATVTNAVNYELRSAGIDGQFGNGDDQFYTVQCLGYSSGLSANYIITDGPLQPGNYRFTIKTGIQDRSGSPLEAAYIRNFQVTSLAGYVRESRDNNSRDKAVSLSPTLLSSADGSFGAILSSARGGNNPWDLVVGKIDGDNHLDVITANGGSDNVSVYLGKGDGTFSAPTNFSVGNNPQGIVLGDFNGDSYKDIAVANYSGSKVSIRLGNGDGTFQTNVDFTVASNPHRIITADFNKDGKADLATANYSGDNVTVLLGNGNGTFAAGVNYASGDGTYDLAAADFDNDGNLDIATANWRDGNVAILFGAGNGTFAAPVLYATGSTSRSLVVGKINADNYPDLIALNAGNNTFSVLLNNGLGVFNNFQTYAASTSDPYGLALEDINQDNKLDLVIANYGQSRVTVFQGKGNGEFLPETDYSVGGNPIAVAVGDINEDGRKDIISANYNDGNVSVLVGNATQLLAENPAGSTLRSAFGQGNVDSGDADYFSFSGTAGQLLEVAAETPGNPGNSQLFYEIYTPEGTRLDYFYPNGNGYGQTPRSKNSPLVLPVSGTYYLSVKRSDQYSGEYRFRVSLLDQPAQFEAESNDQINQSNFVLFQQQGNLAAATVAGYISAGDGSGDFYNLGNLSSNATLSVTFKKPGTSDISPKIEVLSSNGTSLAANAAGSTNLDFVIPSAGNYYVKFTSASGTPGIAAQYLLNISLNDTQSPEIASNNLPGEGTISTLIIDRFNVSFSEELQSSTVNSLSNYDLRSSGADGLFNTPDDVIYILSNPGYGSGLQTGFQIVNGPLQPGNYQFKVTGLKDRSGNALVSYLRQFTIENLPGFTLESQNNDVRTNGTPLLMLESPTGVYTVAARGNLTSTADYDYWSFQGYSNALLTVGIDIPGNPNASSLYLRIDNANGSRLYDFNSDYNGFGQSQRILLPEDGVYTVLVRYNHDYQGEYNLKLLQAIPPIQLEQESNNTVANATVVNLITNGNSRIGTVAGYIYNNVELDYYNLGTLTNGSTVFLATRTPTGSQFAPQVSLYDANSGYLIEAGSGRAGDGVAEVRITKDGTYYAAVRSGDLRQRVDSAYVLDIQVVPTGSVAFPNLQVTTITPPSGTSIKSGDTIGFNYTVKNVGSVSTPVASWTDRVVISQNTTLGDSDDVQLGIYPHTGVLNDGQEYVQNQSAKIPDGITGTYYVIVQTDFANAVNEFVLEGDNITVSQNSFVIQAAPYPDLVVENLAVSAPVGNVYTISWNTANRGTAPVAIPFKERLFVKNTRNNSVLLNIERNVTNAIAAGAVLAQSATITATNAGPHQVLVTTDSSGLVYENNASGHNAAELNTFESAFTILADYNITLAANPSQAGSVTGGGKVKEGSSVTVKATPNTAQLPYSFLNWTENGTFQSGASNYTFTATKDRQLVANFVLPNFQVTAANNPSTAGTVTGAGSYAYGATANLNASPAFGYKFTNWTEGATVIGVNPSISLTVTNARSVTANYAEANLVHVVTTESSPSGIATITGAGIYNNGQSVVVTAPASVTNNATIYTFTRFTLNGTAYQTNRSFTESFTTTDPTNMVLVAEYGSRSQFPLVTNIFANYNNPVPATTNLQLTFQFNRAMKTSPEPTIRMSNTISGASAPVVLTGGTWTSTVNTNDTYHTKAIVVSTGMDGTNRVYISAAQDLDGAATRETNAYNLVLDATFPVISNIKVEPGSGAVVVTWNTDEPSSSQVEFGQTTAYGRRTPLSINLVTSHRVLVSGLTPQTGYHFRVLAQDKAGNLRASADGSFTTLPAPDLLISGINFAPGAWQSGSAITVGWTNSNVGVGPTSGSWYDQITISNKTTGKILVQDYVFYDNSRLGDIPSGSVKTAQYNYVLPEGPDGAGQIEVSIITDFYNNLIESNGSNTAESNNSFVQVKSSVIRSYPDLQVQQLAASPGTIQSGTQVTLTWNDANSGQAGASGLIQDRIVVRNNTSGETLVNTVLGYDSTAVGNAPIGAGETLPRSYKFTLPDGSRGAGDLAIEVTTDIGNVVYEYNASNTGENNNKAILALNSTLATYPDLTVTSISAPASATAGQTVQVTWTVQNRGAKAATGPWVDQIFLSTDTAIGGDQYVGAVTFNDAIPANSSVQRTNTITLPSFGTGNRWVVIRTDAANAIYESDEGNNLSIDDQAINLPSNLIFTLSRPSVPESYGANAVRGTITRNSGTENDLTISLTSSDLSEATVPATVTIPAGQTSVSFPIAAVDDSIVDGTQNVVITANAAGMSSVTANLAVTDDDSAVLTISVNPAVVRENGGPNAALGAITRNTANTEALTVSLASSDPAKLTVPTSVIIPAGQNGATFPIGAVDNAFPNRPARITISASVTGYQSVPAIVDVADDDSPTLTLTLDKAVISEGAANPATYATVTRNPVTSRSLNVLIHSDTESAAKVPVSVVIPPDQASVSFPITAINNDQVNFPQEVRIMAYTADYVFETPLDEGAGLAILTVTDDDGPTLKLTVDSELISERSSTTGRVFRNTPTTNALVVTLTSQDTSEASVPANVTIPIGQASATFTISGVVDSLADGIQPANIVASAPGYTSGHAKVNVSDIDLPDLRVTEISIPTNALTGGSANVSWKVKNEGLSTAVAPWIDRVYLSSTPDGANLQYVGQFIRSSDLAVGEFYERSATVLLPTTPGRFYLVVVTDAVNAVTEGGELNNTTVTSGVINIEPAYRANVQADIETTLAGTSIPLHGQAFKTGSGSPAPFALVTVRVNVKGTRRIIEARSDADGNFQAVFTPLPNEAGLVNLCADHPGVLEDTIQDQVEIYGVRFSDYGLTLRSFPLTTVAGSFKIQNLGDLPLTAVTITASELPASLAQFTFANTNTLQSSEISTVNYVLNTLNVTNEVRINTRLVITTAEGATAEMPLNLTIAPQRPTLVANPGVLSGGMLRGQQRIVEFVVSNTGGASTGPMDIRYPAVDWLKLSSPSNLPSLSPGESTKVTLQLVPPADLPLTRYDGSLVIAAPVANASLNVPFSFRALSEAKGDLKVEVTDDYTFHVAGAPKVQGASVVLTDGLTGQTIVSGSTDTNGIILFTNVAEGTYQLTVSASQHSTYRSPVTIVPGVQTDLTTFIDRQTVSYRWSVVPTEVEDHYKVTLESVFEAEVPIPVVTIDNPMMMPLIVRGIDTQMEIKLTNHGLIAAERVSVVVPQHPDYDIIPLVDVVDSIPAKSSISIPVIVRAKPTAQFATYENFQQRMAERRECMRLGLGRQCGTTFTGCQVYPKLQVKWSFVCGPDRRWHVNEASIVPVCVEESCWDKIKDMLGDLAKNPKDILEWKDRLCDLAAILASCVDECLGTIAKTACGVASGDVKGAVEGALGFGQCWCPSLPSLPSGTPTGGPTGGTTSVINVAVGGLGSADYPIGAPIYWDYSPNCTPGDSVSGGNSLSRQGETRDGGVCARVRLRIEQEAVITRAAFLGTLELENGRTDIDLTNVQLTLDIRGENQEAAGDRFAIRGPELKDLSAIDGTGVLGAGKTGIAKYTFIPNRTAAPEGPMVYRIGGTLKYHEGTNVVEVPLLPDTITVFPDPVLHLVYFQQRDVYSDDPFTDPIEPAEPFALGLMVKNTGKGAALNFKITSGQPEIVENEKGLLIDFKIIGTQIGGEPVAPTLTANLGRIEPAQSKVAIWQMVSSLQGKFLEYKATFEHTDALGDAHLSLIDSVEIHELIHAVKADRQNDDNQPDFLVNDDPDENNLPDTLYLSDGSVAAVNLAANPQAAGTISIGNLQTQITANTTTGWNYLQMPDPGPGFRLYRVVRSDNKEIRVGDNAWTTDRSFPSALAGVRRENLFHLLDFNSTGSYTLYYRINDSEAPSIADIVDVDPIVQTAAVDAVNVIFSEDVDASTFASTNVVLTRNGGSNLINAPLTFTKVTEKTYRIAGLAPFTGEDGNYQLTLNGAGILDFGGNSTVGSASVNWSKSAGTQPVIVSISQINPALRNLPVPSIDVVFSKAIKVSTFDFNDIQLVRDGSANLITSGITITQLTPSSFRIGGLGSLTADSGNYSLTINATGITDTSDNAGIGQLAINWTQDTVAPTVVSLEKVTTNPRNTVVPSLDVKFSEAINESSFDFSDITLSRNGGANIITSQTKVTKIDATTYRITDFSFVSGAEGSYIMTVNGSGIRDAAGNAGLGSASSSWVMDTTKPAVPITFAITPDLGKSTTDGLTSTQKVTLSGVLLETNLSVRVFDVTANADLGLAIVTNKTFTKALELAGGPHRLRIRAIDAAGNLSDETFFEVFIDLAGPTALITAVTPDPIDAAVPSVDITFSEALNDVKFTREDLQLNRNGGTNLINSQVQIQFVGTNTYRVAGLSTLTADGGLYALTLDLTGIEDAAGNAGKDSVTTTWRRLGANTAPVLSQIPPQIVSAENPLVVTNTAFDADIPANKLTFSLGAGAPSGATINATNGVFAWTPSRSQAGQTFNITITVTDDGTPALSDSKVLNITVTDFAELNLGRTVVRSGDRGSVPLEFFGSAPVSQFNFLLSFRTNYLTNITVDALVPEVGTATVQKLSASQYMVRVQARSGSQFSTRANVVEIGFNAFTNRTSAFIPLQLSNSSVTKSDNTQITRVFTKNGRVVVVDAEPLVEGLIQTNGSRALIVYGKASSTYQVQSAPTLNGGTNWTETGRLTLPGLFDTFQLQTQTNRVLFYRAIEKP